MKQNKTHKLLVSLLFITVLTLTISCSEKDILDLKPYNGVNEATAFSSIENIEKSLNGIYNIAQKGYFIRGENNQGRGYPFGAAYFQQNDLRGEDLVNVSTFYRFTYQTTYTPNTENNSFYWISLYKLINECNLFINGIEKAQRNNLVDTKTANKYIGEALFFRAFSYLELLKHFSRPYSDNPSLANSGVPYLTKPSTGSKTALENSEKSRGTVKENYQQILKDLNNAEKFLGSSKEILRATKYAAIALKTRVYLNMGEWQNVINEANKLEGNYSLTTSPETPFRIPRKNTESIFSLNNSADNNPTGNGALASMYSAKGRRKIAISPIIWNSSYWKENDKRRKLLTSEDSEGAKFVNKYTDVTNRTDPSPLFRYAEVLLNKAEAKLRLNQSSFIDDLNKVRERSTSAYKTSDFNNEKEKLSAIIFERRIEFLGEGMRWGDIHRLQKDPLTDYDGIPAKYANDMPTASSYKIGKGYVITSSDLRGFPYSDHKFLWPIPTAEITVNKVLRGQQNPGW